VSPDPDVTLTLLPATIRRQGTARSGYAGHYNTITRKSDDIRSKRIALTPRGIAAATVIRQAVAEVETSWEQQLGPKRFAQLRNLLHELNAFT
jgi:hypothetical protein